MTDHRLAVTTGQEDHRLGGTADQEDLRLGDYRLGGGPQAEGDHRPRGTTGWR